MKTVTSEADAGDADGEGAALQRDEDRWWRQSSGGGGGLVPLSVRQF